MSFKNIEFQNGNLSIDQLVAGADYALTVAEILGANVDYEKAAVTAVQAGRLAFERENVEKPNNESAKLLATGIATIFAQQTGNRSGAALLELIAMGLIDANIHD